MAGYLQRRLLQAQELPAPPAQPEPHGGVLGLLVLDARRLISKSIQLTPPSGPILMFTCNKEVHIFFPLVTGIKPRRI